MTNTPSDLQSLSGRSRSGTPQATAALPPTRWKSRILLPGAIVVAVLLLLTFTSYETLMPATPVQVVPVVVKNVEGAAGSVTIQAPGWLEPDPHPYYVAALVEGIVTQVLVLEGDRVEPGQVVALLDDAEARLAVRRAEADLEASGAALASSEADLTAARLRIEHLIESSRAVDVGKARVAEARANVDKVEADIAVEAARLAELQDELDRKSRLVASEAVSEATVARLRLRVDAQSATLDATRAHRSVLEAKVAEARAVLVAASANRELLIEERQAVALAEAAVASRRAEVAAAEVARDEAALRLDRMSIRSAVGGIVMRRLTSPGSKLAQAGTEHSLHVFHLYDPEHLQVRVDVPLADAAQVQLGQAAEIMVEVMPDRVFTGRVTRAVHEADIQKNTVEVKVAIDDPSSALKPEMLARVKFLAVAATPDGTVRQRVFAPQELLVTGSDGASVMIVTDRIEDRGRATRRAITTGTRRIGGWVEIDDGLQIGDLLIAGSQTDVRPGARVRITGEATSFAGGAGS